MIKADLHTHTVASGHAYSTILENVRVAEEKGVELLGIADHGPASSGGPPKNFFYACSHVPKIIGKVNVLFGVEANVIDTDGNLDIDEKIIKKLDFVMAGFHEEGGYKCQGIKKNTKAMINAIKNPAVKLISHPHVTMFAMDMEAIAEAACENNVLLELNSSHFYKAVNDFEEIKKRIKRMMKVVKKNGKRAIINSDAHIALSVGRDKEIREHFNELEISEADIINNDIPALKKFLGID